MVDHHQVLVEPSSAVVVAACLKGSIGQIEGEAVLVVSGRNIDGTTLRRALRA
jgi:threonine dehydratase